MNVAQPPYMWSERKKKEVVVASCEEMLQQLLPLLRALSVVVILGKSEDNCLFIVLDIRRLFERYIHFMLKNGYRERSNCFSIL